MAGEPSLNVLATGLGFSPFCPGCETQAAMKNGMSNTGANRTVRLNAMTCPPAAT
jgi:hypothetical protein